MQPPEKPWSLSSEDILQKLEAGQNDGLDPEQVEQRRRRFGSNAMGETRKKSSFSILIEQVKNFIALLLASASIAALAFGQWLEGISIAVALAINVVIGFVTELRAIRSMEALNQLGKVKARVRRGGQIQEIPSEELVIGDIVPLDAGDVVPADVRLLESSALSLNEATLTGESNVVTKSIEPIDQDSDLHDRTNMAFKGTAVTNGSGFGVITGVGRNTEVGKIATMTEEAEEEVTPLERRLNQLGKRLLWLTLAVALAVGLSGIIRGQELLLMIETAVALAVAAIPEGLPVVATVALGRGMWRMAKRNALVNKLAAVETLGATTLICTDKTGTLTQNKMRASELALSLSEKESVEVVEIKNGDNGEAWFEKRENQKVGADQLPVENAIRVGVLCSNAELGETEEEDIGEPLEVALVRLGKKVGRQRQELLENYPEQREVAFNTDTKMMATFHQNDGKMSVMVKGAPEKIIQSCSRVLVGENEEELDSDLKDTWSSQNDELASRGLRVLGLARKSAQNQDEDPYADLTLVGLVGLYDPPREEVRPALDACTKAGINTIVVTGDNAKTAMAVSKELGLASGNEGEVVSSKELKEVARMNEEEKKKLLDARVFARVTPKNKLDLVGVFQDQGQIVAMTGDGVNDAPALKQANIGIAMGIGGTQVAKEASDMILRDNAFASIVAAVEHGRVIFQNIRTFVIYLLSGNLAEITIVGAVLLAGGRLPILPLQILYLNMLCDVFPALALGMSGVDEDMMKKPPRNPKEPILTRLHWGYIIGFGLMIAAIDIVALSLARGVYGFTYQEGVTVAFLTLGFGRLWHTFNMRRARARVFTNRVVRNPMVWGGIGICVLLLLLAVYFRPLGRILELSVPSPLGWTLILAGSLLVLVVGQIVLGVIAAVKKK